MLEKNRIGSLFDALRVYPAGRVQLDWLAQQFGGIMGRERPLRPGGLTIMSRKPLAHAPDATAKPDRAAKRPEGKATRQATAAAPLSVPVTPLPLPSLPLVDIDIPLRLEADLSTLLTAFARSPEVDGRTYQLRERLAHLGLVQGFDELLCLPQLVGVEPLWHQIETVRKVLKQFRGRVLLADEVGLGKTIEAGMVLKEYAMRGMGAMVGSW